MKSGRLCADSVPRGACADIRLPLLRSANLHHELEHFIAMDYCQSELVRLGKSRRAETEFAASFTCPLKSEETDQASPCKCVQHLSLDTAQS